MMRVLLLGLVATFATSQHAVGLSCLPPDIRQNYQEARESPHNYYVVEGKLTLANGPIEIKRGNDGMPVPVTHVEAKMSGVSLGASGKKTPFNRPVTVEIECVLEWCGSFAPGANGLAFIREERGELFLEIGPCGGDMFPGPNEAQRKQVQKCLGGGPCKPG